MKIVAAFAEAVFVTVAIYVATGLTLFVAGASLDIPGVMTSRSGTHDGHFETSLSFRPEGGALLVVILTASFYWLHSATARRARLLGSPTPGPPR